MNFSIFFKLLKDGLRGGMISFLPAIMNGMGSGQTIVEIVGGLVSAFLGILAGAVRSSSVVGSDWLKILNDTLYGVLIAAQPLLQNGLAGGEKAAYIAAGVGIAALGVFSNVLHDDFAPSTAVMKIVKDLIISVINTAIPALQAGLTAGTSLVVVLAGVAHSCFSVAGNTLEHDLFGMTGQTPSVLGGNNAGAPPVPDAPKV